MPSYITTLCVHIIFNMQSGSRMKTYTFPLSLLDASWMLLFPFNIAGEFFFLPFFTLIHITGM